MLRNSGRGLLGLVADSDIRCFLGLLSGLHNNGLNGACQVSGNSIAMQHLKLRPSQCMSTAVGLYIFWPGDSLTVQTYFNLTLRQVNHPSALW
jgi:hypothetical protein